MANQKSDEVRTLSSWLATCAQFVSKAALHSLFQCKKPNMKLGFLLGILVPTAGFELAT